MKIFDLSSLTGSQLKGLRSMVFIAVIDAFLASLPYAFLYYIILNMLSAYPDTTYQFKLVLYCGFFMLIRVFLTRIFYYHISLIGFNAGAIIRKRLGDHLRNLPMGFFYRTDMSNVNNTLLKDIDMIETIFTHIYAPIIATISILCFFALGLLFKDWRMALAMFSTLPLAFAAYFFTKNYAQKWHKHMQQLMFKLNDALIEYIDGLKELKSYRKVGKEFERLSQILIRTRKESLVAEKAGAWPIYSFNLLTECGFIMLLFALTWGWIGQHVELPVVIVFLIAAVRFFRPLLNMSMFLAELNYFSLAVERVKNIFSIPKLVHQNDTPDIKDMTISLENIQFSYPNKPLLFNKLNLIIPSGKITALVGTSGSGKSTLASLIARFWNFEQGNIWIGTGDNKIDLTTLSPEYWLQHLSIVFQKNYMLTDTIANNLRIAKPEATDEELLTACHYAQLSTLIESLPEGINTKIGAEGNYFSGGELQRISIARALLKNAPLIILDEATASLDPENEYEIQLALQALVQEKTVLVIAHKLSSIQHVDNIVVMDKGKIIEQGTHQELIASCGLYHELWELQQQNKHWIVLNNS